jgi:hemolysin activation/secretion protein
VKRNTWLSLSILALGALPALAQQQTRPDSGTLLQQPRTIDILPPPGGAPTVVLPPAPPAAPVDKTIQVTPAAFQIQGNTLFSEAQLQPLVAEWVGKPTNMEGLLEAAAAVRRFYRERGYLLTEAYLPQQQFAQEGGTVVIQVLEARVGHVAVRVEGEGISESLATKIVGTHLHTGDPISEYSLDKPVLLLRDLAGFDATAAVEPGENPGEANVTVVVKPFGPKVDGLVGVDNYGVRSAGEIQAYAAANINNLTGWGDTLNIRLQTSEGQDNNLYRIGYSIPVTGYATKLGLSAARTDYALGKQFAALGATGVADIYDLSLTHPFIRSRVNNVLGAVTLERKNLNDQTTTPMSNQDRHVDLVRLSMLGNFVDNLTLGSFNSYALNLSLGNLDMDGATLALDQSAAGLHTAGHFEKLNLEFLRTTYVSTAGRVNIGLQAQMASKNLTSAEKLALGGQAGVRGYPAGEAVGDEGAIVNLEYQHTLPDFGLGFPVNASVFYDWGHIKYNHDNLLAIPVNSENLSSAGIGMNVGSWGNFLVTAQLAWRLDRAPASDPDKKPRVWLSLQKWL